jgi:hypothetical protein
MDAYVVTVGLKDTYFTMDIVVENAVSPADALAMGRDRMQDLMTLRPQLAGLQVHAAVKVQEYLK